jgi:2-dehydropantoate 2-reductase
VPIDHVVVLGAGAVGSVYAARLAGCRDVTVVARAPHVEAIVARGLRVTGLEERQVTVRAVTALDAVPARTLVLLTTKVNGNRAAAGAIAPLVHDDTTILCVQNGLGGEDIVRDALAGAPAQPVVLRAVTHVGAIFREPGVVDLRLAGPTVIEAHARSREIAELLVEGGLTASVSDDLTPIVWRKLIANCVINPITAIAAIEVGGIANPQLGPLKRIVVDECLAVARAAGVRLEGDLVADIDATFGPSRNIASMRQDLLAGRPTEIDHMNGAVVALGRRLGVDCPMNAALTAVIKAMEGAAEGPKADGR